MTTGGKRSLSRLYVVIPLIVLFLPFVELGNRHGLGSVRPFNHRSDTGTPVLTSFKYAPIFRSGMTQ